MREKLFNISAFKKGAKNENVLCYAKEGAEPYEKEVYFYSPHMCICMSRNEYEAYFSNVPHKTNESGGIADIYKKAVANAFEGGVTAVKTPLSYDVDGKKIYLYHCENGVAGFRADFIDAFGDCTELTIKNPVSTAVVTRYNGVVGIVCPIRLPAKITKAVEAYMGVE